MGLRETVLEELARRKKTMYWLANHPEIGCHPDSVYRWLRGDTDSIRSVEQILKVLGLRVQAKSITGTRKR